MEIAQTMKLAELEQTHGQVHRVPDHFPVAEELLAFCTTGARVYMCRNCAAIFTIEPDGEIRAWAWDHDAHPVSFGPEDLDE